jgi:predicted nucleotidyltransferase
LVDILPFGEIAGPNKEIHWPPSDTVMMSVAGFEDAFKSAIRVKVRANPSLEILVASLYSRQHFREPPPLLELLPLDLPR